MRFQKSRFLAALGMTDWNISCLDVTIIRTFSFLALPGAALKGGATQAADYDQAGYAEG
jgi:hypothetical protein